jgi:putative endonuclease
MRERLPCVYILASGVNGTLYVGVTSNLIGRVIQHREGAFDGFTKRYGVHRLVWFEGGETMEAAIAREKQVKRYRRDWKRNLIERENPMWNDLAVGLGLEPLAVVTRGEVDPGTRPGCACLGQVPNTCRRPFFEFAGFHQCIACPAKVVLPDVEELTRGA